jgi:hypothetical protein
MDLLLKLPLYSHVCFGCSLLDIARVNLVGQWWQGQSTRIAHLMCPHANAGPLRGPYDSITVPRHWTRLLQEGLFENTMMERALSGLVLLY